MGAAFPSPPVQCYVSLSRPTHFSPSPEHSHQCTKGAVNTFHRLVGHKEWESIWAYSAKAAERDISRRSQAPPNLKLETKVTQILSKPRAVHKVLVNRGSILSSPGCGLSHEQRVAGGWAVSVCPAAEAPDPHKWPWAGKRGQGRQREQPSRFTGNCQRTKARDRTSLFWEHYSWICCLWESSSPACDFPYTTRAPIKAVAFSQMFSTPLISVY